MQNDGAFPALPMMTSQDSEPAPSPARAPVSLDSRAKAAIVVRMLLNEGADIALEELPDALQERLTHQIARMGLVDRATMDAVLTEFADALDGVGMAFPHGVAGALDILDGRISPQTAARLRKEAGVRRRGDPWARLRAMDVTDLAEIAQSESIEVAAVLLSKLETPKAAALLGKLPGPLARRITYAVSQTESVTPEAVDRIGLSLAAQLDEKPIPAFSDEPGKRVGAILNQSRAVTRDDMLASLDETDADFAQAVRKQIFTFAHISVRVDPKDVPAIVRAVEADTLVTALAGATDEQTSGFVEYLLSNMSQRMADNLRDEIQDRGKVKPKDAEAAMNEVVTAIRNMEAAGEIDLRVEGEDEEEDESR